ALEGAVDRPGHSLERRERRADHDVDARLRPQREDNVAGEGHRVGRCLVHLPVAGDELLADHGVGVSDGTLQDSRNATPGRTFPSRYSRLAPPPVEQCVTLPATPNFRADRKSTRLNS